VQTTPAQRASIAQTGFPPDAVVFPLEQATVAAQDYFYGERSWCSGERA